MNNGDDDGDYEGNDRDCDDSSRTTPRVSYHEPLITNLPMFHVIWQVDPPLRL